ncbi:hypothetical protein HZC00_00530 [Candidatus Kaiserbacteria bacterium]|nr:hypothetical protein [Candidatus Kaiserbacteria bacterium]
MSGNRKNWGYIALQTAYCVAMVLALKMVHIFYMVGSPVATVLALFMTVLIGLMVYYNFKQQR